MYRCVIYSTFFKGLNRGCQITITEKKTLDTVNKPDDDKNN